MHYFAKCVIGLTIESGHVLTFNTCIKTEISSGYYTEVVAHWMLMNTMNMLNSENLD